MFDDIKPDCIKIGVLFNREIILEVTQFSIKYYKEIPIVIDPVMVAKNGASLLLQDAIETLKYEFIPLATPTTPNIPETILLAGLPEMVFTRQIPMEQAAHCQRRFRPVLQSK